MAKKTKIVHVAVSKDTEAQLKQRAKLADMPVSAIIRMAINSYLTPAVTASGQSKEQAA